MPTFKATRKSMTPQKTARGKVKTDINGNPLCSVQLIQHPQQRHIMANIMQEFQQRIYKENISCFPAGAHQIGIDPVAYSCEEIQDQIIGKMKDWLSYDKSHHIFEAFVIRHNWMLDKLIESIYNDWHDIPEDIKISFIKELDDEFRIVVPLPMVQQMMDSINNILD